MIVKLKCVERCHGGLVNVGNEYDALVDKNDIYVIRNDAGYFSFIDFYDVADGKWEIVRE